MTTTLIRNMIFQRVKVGDLILIYPWNGAHKVIALITKISRCWDAEDETEIYIKFRIKNDIYHWRRYDDKHWVLKFNNEVSYTEEEDI